MTFPIGLHPGAVWRRADFQIHTPRDPQWGGSPHLPGGTSDCEAAREAWADSFVQKCLEIGLEAIAITDHHDLCMIEYVRGAIARLPDGVSKPWLFPGMEVTCRDAVQCLVLFDQGSDEIVWRRLFGGHLQNVADPDRDLATNPQAIECGKDIEPFIQSVTGDATLSPSCIILPHASNDGAHKSMMRQGFAPRFATLPFDGVYTDKTFQALDEGTLNKIYGRMKAWGSRRRGVIPTGDNRHQDFAKLGAKRCWIRLGEPTAESIRQAVLADDARLAYEQPALPSHRIIELSITSALTGPSFRLSFNDGFTALIGGRGSGKSAILEYLRFGLGRSASDTVSDDEHYRSRDQEMISQTLKDGEVSVVLERDGVREKWTRTGAKREAILVSSNGDDVQEITIDAAQQRFRARGFYQKQLSTLVTDRERTAEQITGIAAAEFIDKRRLLDRDIAAAQREVEAAYQRVVELWVAEAEHKQSLSAVADLRKRLEAVRTKMSEAGLSPEHQALLDAAPTYKLVESLAEEAARDLRRDIENISKQRSAFMSLRSDRWSDVRGSFDEIGRVVGAIDEARGLVDSAITSALDALQQLQIKQDNEFTALNTRREAFDAKHAQAVAQQVSTKALVDEAARLNAELQTASAGERRSAARLEALAPASIELSGTRKRLTEKVEELHSLLTEAAAQVEEMSGKSLRASASRETIPRQYVSTLLKICDGNRIREVQSKCEERVRVITSAVSDETWSKVTDNLMEVRRHQIEKGTASVDLGGGISAVLTSTLLGEVTTQQLRSLYDSIDDNAVRNMLTAVPEDYISFEYRDAKDFIPFGQASPGQQASALLHLLLNQEAGTLLIDQPEDDLDNRIIMKIATLLQTTKRRRQLIFATHNPNFVVNGDADKIVVLASGSAEEAGEDLPRISVNVDGAIETPAVRTAVTETMEGGQAAFELRSRKYSFPS